MAANQPRGTPGMMLLGFAVVTVIIALGCLRSSWHGVQPKATGLTGLGDAAFYDGKLTENDFFNPALVFDTAPHGLHRRMVNAVHRDDTKMRRVGLERSGLHFVYTDANAKPGAEGRPHARWYLKAEPNSYIEFGERNLFETFIAPPRR